MNAPPDTPFDLGRRERQIMEAVYRRGGATVSEVLAELSDRPSYSAVRTMLGKLEGKGLLRHEQDGARYVYRPTVPLEEARDSTLRRMVRTLFGGSTAAAMSTLLDLDADELSPSDLDALAELIAEKRRQGK